MTDRQKVDRPSNFSRLVIYCNGVGILAGLFVLTAIGYLETLKPILYKIGAVLAYTHYISVILTYNTLKVRGILKETHFLKTSSAVFLIGFVCLYLAFFHFEVSLSVIVVFLIGFVLFFGNLFHVAMQHYGVLRVMSANSKENSDTKFDKMYCTSLIVFAVSLAWIYSGKRWGMLQDPLLSAVPFSSQAIEILVVLFFLFMISRDMMIRQFNWLRTMYLFSLAVMPTMFIRFDPIVGYFSYSVSHCITEIFLGNFLYSATSPLKKNFNRYFWYTLALFFFGLVYYLVPTNKIAHAILVLEPLRINFELVTNNSIYNIFFGAVVVWLVWLHFFLSREIYMMTEIRKLFGRLR